MNILFPTSSPAKGILFGIVDFNLGKDMLFGSNFGQRNVKLPGCCEPKFFMIVVLRRECENLASFV